MRSEKVPESPSSAFADDVFYVAFVSARSSTSRRRERRAAARGGRARDHVHDLGRRQAERGVGAAEAAVGFVVGEVERIDDPQRAKVSRSCRFR